MDLVQFLSDWLTYATGNGNARVPQRVQFDLQPTTNTHYWRNFCIFPAFFVPFIMRTSHIF